MSASNTPEYARVDGTGRLVDASPRLSALNAAAGGHTGAPLAVPQLATLARLVATLRVPIARTVFAADGDGDVELWVQATTDDDGVALAIAGWSERRARRSWLVDQPLSDLPVVEQFWRWTTDARLIVTDVDFGEEAADAPRPRDLIGRPLTRLVRLIESIDGDLPLLAALADGMPFDDQRAVRRDRPNHELLLAADPVRDAVGVMRGFSGTATGASRTVAVVEPVVAEATFAATLQRALRTPIDSIIARADDIGAQVDGPLRRDYADYAGDIASAGRHLLALVDDLADLEAVERPDLALLTEQIDLADVTRRAAGLLSVRAADRSVRIDRPDSDEQLPAMGDFRRVLQILVNILTNAVRYSPPGAMIWLRTESDGDNAVVVVADQGKGIAPENHARVFEKFERVDPSEPGGSGLGLYISRRLARAMGGDITLDSAPGQGARFVLTLPVA